LLSYAKLSKKPLLFKLFTGLSIQEFDDIYDKEITKRYHDYELQRLSSKRKDRKRDIGAGRHFKLDIKYISYAFSLLSSLYHIHVDRLSSL
jgi:hypothetical protein